MYSEDNLLVFFFLLMSLTVPINGSIVWQFQDAVSDIVILAELMAYRVKWLHKRQRDWVNTILYGIVLLLPNHGKISKIFIALLN